MKICAFTPYGLGAADESLAWLIGEPELLVSLVERETRKRTMDCGLGMVDYRSYAVKHLTARVPNGGSCMSDRREGAIRAFRIGRVQSGGLP